MDLTVSRVRSFPVLTFVLAWICLIALRLFGAFELSGAPVSVGTGAVIACGELWIPGLVLGALAFRRAVSVPLVSFVCLGSVALLTGLDGWSMWEFRRPASLEEIARFLPEAGKLFSAFLNLSGIVFTALVLRAAYAPRDLSIGPRAAFCSSVLLFSCAGIATLRSPTPFLAMRISEIASLFDGDRESTVHYSSFEKDVARLRHARSRIFEIPPSRPNLILLVVEALSAQDSRALGGANDYLVALDELTAKGRLYTSFHTNYWDTEGSLVALLQSIPPIPYPGGTRRIFDSFAFSASPVRSLADRGYRTEFLTTGPVSFLDKNVWLSRIGFERVAGLWETPEFVAAQKFAFNSPSDELLYDKAIGRVRELSLDRAPYFLVLETTASHIPWNSPDGAGNDREHVFRYVARQIREFHARLEAERFFDDGVLFVVGDHPAWENKDWKIQLASHGPAFVAHVYACAFGSGIEPGSVDDRELQHVNLLPYFDSILSRREVPRDPLVFVNNYSLRFTSPALAPVVRVFLPREFRKEQKFVIEDDTLAPLVATSRASEVAAAAAIHSWRAYASVLRREEQSTCSDPLSRQYQPVKTPGIAVASAERTDGAYSTISSWSETADTPVRGRVVYSSYVTDPECSRRILRVTYAGRACIRLDGAMVREDRAPLRAPDWYELKLAASCEPRLLEIELAPTADSSALGLAVWDDTAETWKEADATWFTVAAPAQSNQSR